jgi:hypothetical protein
VERLAAHLHAAIGIGVRAHLLHVRRGREDDVRELGGLGEEDVLHDQEIEVGQRLPHLVHVRV